MRNKTMTKLVDVRRLHLWIIAGPSMVNVTKGSPGQGQVVLPNSLMVDHIFYFFVSRPRPSGALHLSNHLSFFSISCIKWP